MDSSPVASFLRFLAGFLLFITLSFGITFAVNKYTSAQASLEAAASAQAQMLQYQ